jgi:O-methyltransferase involved in polyketide biosynthesis
LDDSPGMSLAVTNKAIESYQQKIFADPVAEYLIEYGAPRELFEFMKMGPARATDEEEQKRSLERCKILLEAVKQAADRLLGHM